MGSGASAQLDPAALANAEKIAEQRGECGDDPDGLKGLCAQVKEENDILVDYVARRDAITIAKACSGIGTDESTLTRIICGRSKKHLQTVDLHYREAHDGKELFKLLKGETSGSLAKMLCWRSMDLVEFRATMMDKAMDGFGTNEELLVETLVTCTNAEITELREYYERTREKSLMERITSETSGDLEDFLVKILAAERDESEDVDEGAAEEAAEALYKAGVGNWWGTDEEVFFNTLCVANPKQCQAIATAYENAKGKSLSKAIDKEFGSDTAYGLNAMLCDGKVDFLAKRIRRAMKGMGTDEAAICRCLAGAANFETCRAVAARFFEIEDRTLEDALASELGGLFEGDFKRATIAMVTDPPPHEPTKGLQKQVDDLGDVEEDDADALNARLDLLMQTNEALKEHIAFEDAHEINKACNGGWTGIGTDEDALITVLGNRTKDQLDRIDMQFRELFGKPLADEIKGETSGNFKDMLMLMQMGEAEGDAYLLKKATDGWGTDENALIQVIAPKSPARLRDMRETFQARYDKSLMDLLDDETSGWFEGDFNAVIKALLSRSENVDEEAEVDEGAAAEAATALMTAMSGFGTDEQAVIDILCTANNEQIKAIRVAFENENGNSLERWLEGDFSGNARETLLALCVPGVDYYCIVLKRAMDGLGTDEAAITRVLGSLNKADIGLLKGRYFEKYDVDLDHALKGEVSGSWGKTVLTWVCGIDPTLGAEEQLNEVTLEEEEEAPPEDEEEEEDEGPPPDSEEEEEEEEEDDEEEDERRRKRKKQEQKRKREQKKKEKEKAKKKKMLREAAARVAKERRNLLNAIDEYGEKLNIELDAEFDGELYCIQNNIDPDRAGKAWRHFKKKGFWKGQLLRFRTDDGIFIGALDLHKVLENADADEKPVSIDHAAWNALFKGGRPDTLPFSVVVPVCMFGRFSGPLFKSAHRDLKPFWKKPKKSKLNARAMMEQYEEIEEEYDGNPYKWLRNHMSKEVNLANGRSGKVDWAWYQKRYKPGKSMKKAKKYFKKKDWKHRPQLKIKPAVAYRPWQYYRKIGYEEGRTLVISNKLGRFQGTFSEEGYAQANDIDESEAWETYCENRGDDASTPIAVCAIDVIKLYRGAEVDYLNSDDEEEDSDEDEFDGDHEDSDEDSGEEDSEEEEEEEEEEDDAPRRRRGNGRRRRQEEEEEEEEEDEAPKGRGKGFRRRAMRRRRRGGW